MCDIELLARLVKHMPAAGFTLTAGKQPIGELLAVVRQDLGNPDRATSQRKRVVAAGESER
jgi:hypothetical protein